MRIAKSIKTLTPDKKHKRIIEFIEPNPKDKILVIGTGIFPKTEFWLFHSFKCRNIVSGDIDEKNIINGKRMLPELEFIILDAQKRFPFEKEMFDKVILIEVLEHLKDDAFTLQEIKRVLKSSGALILSVPKKRWFTILNPASWIQHEREYTEKSITRVLGRNGFKIKKLFVGGNIYELFSLWIHLILKHFFHIFCIENFFQKKIDKSWQKDFKGEGTDIIIQGSIF